MPWTTPSLRQTREMVRDDIATTLSGATVIGNKVLRVMADAMAGLARLTLKYIDWLALQLLPDTAEKEWLDRHGEIWLVNADGSKGRKAPGLASGTVAFTGVTGTFVPEGTELTSTLVNYETIEDITIGSGPTEAAVRSLTVGLGGNLAAGTQLTMVLPIAGVDSAALVVDLRGGIDEETDDDLRARVLQRIQKPPMGGDADDYVAWVERIPAVTRAWCAPREMGMGTITVRFMCDGLRKNADPLLDGFPLEEDINIARNYLDTVRPVAVRDFFVVAPVPEPIDFGLTLVNDSIALREQVKASVAAMIKERAKTAYSVNGELLAGTTIYAGWVSEAIGRIADEFTLRMYDHPMPHNGALAVLGEVIFDAGFGIPYTARSTMIGLSMLRCNLTPSGI